MRATPAATAATPGTRAGAPTSSTPCQPARAPPAAGCTAPCWTSYSRSWNPRRWKPPPAPWPTPGSTTAITWPRSSWRSNAPGSKPTGRCSSSNEVEPGNRLVARTLEARLEEQLAAVQHAEASLAAARTRGPVQLTSQELDWLTRAGADIRAIFDAPTTTNSQRKQLIRAVISEITVTTDRTAGTCHVLITWQGTATTTITVPLPRPGSQAIATSEDTISLIRRLAAGHHDTTIARILGRQHRRTATGLAWTRDRVTAMRRTHDIPHRPSHPANVSSTRHDDHMATVPQAAQLLGVSKTTIYRWLRDGFVTSQQLTPGAPWQIRINQALRDKIRPSVPDGWLPLDQAARALGITRQTVLHKIQRGELAAIYTTSGRRQGLRIQVKPAQPGLFDTPH